MNTKGDGHMWWVIIGAVLALMVFVVYGFAMNKGIGNAFKSIFRIQDETNDRAQCSVLPWTNGDNDGDGIRDDLPECARFKESSKRETTSTTTTVEGGVQ